MAGYDGNGNYVRPYNWTNDAANHLPIDATKFDTDGNTVASAFNICLTRDNQGKPTAPLTWAQPLSLQEGSDGTLFTLARTGGANNPQITFGLLDALTGLQLANGTNDSVVLYIAQQGGQIGFKRSSDGAVNGFVGSRSGTSSYSLYNSGGTNSEVEAAGGGINLKTTSAVRLAINNVGGVTINAPTSGTALTVNPVSGALAMSVVSSAGINAIQIDSTASAAASIKFVLASVGSRVFETSTGANTGAAAPTLSSNKPGGPNGVIHWMLVNIGGTNGYIPVFGG